MHKIPRKYSTFKCKEHKNPGNYSISKCTVPKIPGNYSIFKCAVHDPAARLRQSLWLRKREREREIWGLTGEIRDDRGKIAHGVDVPEGKILAPVALVGTRCKHGACQEVSKPPRTMPPPWPSLGRRAGAMACPKDPVILKILRSY